MANILIVDDEKNIRDGLKEALSGSGYQVFSASDGKEGLMAIMTHSIDLAILDIQIPKMNGIEMMKKIVKMDMTVPVIFITGHGSVEIAVDAMREGAYDFITKPINLEKLELIIKRALKQKNIEKENHSLIVKLKTYEIGKTILGDSRAVNHLREIIERVAPSRSNIYIYGESGTGKELICDAIHSLGGGDKPLVKVNCAALTPTLLETELFGHVKGAFTGADSDKIGRFEQANTGTLFLDEVSEIPPYIQVKLLRVLQERVIERVGSGKPISLDIRLICASNKDLKQEVGKGNFREDLFYRINVLDINVPPLRERRGDIESLACHYLQLFSKENRKNMKATSSFFNCLENYSWPGNIRQLANVMEKVVIMSQSNKLTVNDLPEEIRKSEFSKKLFEVPLGLTMKEIQDLAIEETIRYCNGNKSQAAKILQVGRKRLYQ